MIVDYIPTAVDRVLNCTIDTTIPDIATPCRRTAGSEQQQQQQQQHQQHNRMHCDLQPHEMGIVEGLEIPPSVEGLETPPSVEESLAVKEPLPKHDGCDDDDIQTVEEARTVIKQLKDRCRYQTHQTLLWRKKAKMQEERMMKTRAEFGIRLESLTSDLLLFESRLSRKQRAIGELLEQRECVIERQQHVIRFLRSRLADFGVSSGTGTGIGGGGGDGGPTSDDGNVDDSDSAVIMEEDESGNSQEDASEQQPQTPVDAPTPGGGHGGGGAAEDGGQRSPAAGRRDGRETDGRGGENVTATTYNRVMSNHRSVTKPKDVKYKRINKAKSKSLEELRGRLKNWVDRGQRMSLTVDPTYG